MRELFYALKGLINGRNNNLTVRIITLSVGICGGLLLFAKIAYERSYDSFYTDSERIYQIRRIVSNQKKTITYAPLPDIIKSDINSVEVATTLKEAGELLLQKEDRTFAVNELMADTSLFRLFGIQMLYENKAQAITPSSIYISAKTAIKLFGFQNAVGKEILNKSNQSTLTVIGIFEDIPTNSHLKMEVISPFNWRDFPNWRMDTFWGYIKLAKGISPEDIEKQIPRIIPNHYDAIGQEKEGSVSEYYLVPLTDIHKKEPTIEDRLLVLSILGFSLLLFSILNYLLISISSLLRKAKKVGVLKCNGAKNKQIFIMFIYETAILFLVSTLVSVLFLAMFKSSFENRLEAKLSDILYNPSSWIILFGIFTVILLFSMIPAGIFSSIPVTQVFKVYTETKKGWKKALMFGQFCGIAFMFSFVMIIYKQHHLLINKDLGYNTKNIIYMEKSWLLSDKQRTLLYNELSKLPQIVELSAASNIPIQMGNGLSVGNEITNESFSSRGFWIDRSYIDLFGLTLLEGHNFTESKIDSSVVIVNESFVKKMGWTDSPIGKAIKVGHVTNEGIIIGLVKDFQTYTLFEHSEEYLKGIPPLILSSAGVEESGMGRNTLIMKVTNITPQLLTTLDETIKNTTKNEDVYFQVYQDQIRDTYKDSEQFLKSATIAAIAIALVTFLGLIGFVEDEIVRKQKEIAIRKVFGSDILQILLKSILDVVVLSIPAFIIGFIGSYIVAQRWLQQFAYRVQADLYFYMGCTVILIMSIVGILTFRLWKTVNSNPIKYLQTE